MKRIKISNFNILPIEIILETFLFLELKDIPKCLVLNKEIYQIDNSEYFWKSLFDRRFKYGCPDKFKNYKKWKMKYRDFKKFIEKQIKIIKKLRYRFQVDQIEYLDNKKIFIEYVKIDGLLLNYASDRLKNDKEIIFEAVKQNGWVLACASNRLRDDKQIVLAAVKSMGYALKFASDRLKDDKEIVLEAVKQYGCALQFASVELKSNKEVVLAAVKKDGESLEYVSDRLRDDKKFIFEAIKKHRDAFLFASNRLKK